MGSLGTAQLISLLLAVATVAALFGFIASTVALRKRRARRQFLLGFACGLLAGALVRSRRRVRNALGAVVRTVALPMVPPRHALARAQMIGWSSGRSNRNHR